jgi:hypothetical protein
MKNHKEPQTWTDSLNKQPKQQNMDMRFGTWNIRSLYRAGSLISCLLLKSVKIRIYKTIILPVVLYGFETWSLTLREEYKLRVFENRVLRRIFGLKRDEVMGSEENCITRSCMIFTRHLV